MERESQGLTVYVCLVCGRAEPRRRSAATTHLFCTQDLIFQSMFCPKTQYVIKKKNNTKTVYSKTLINNENEYNKQ